MAQKIKQLAELTPLQGWTIETYAAHNEAMRACDQRFHEERDRRYAEAATLNAVALKIKETADLAALTLAREGQVYKEAQNDIMRDKSLQESGIYATNSSVSAAIDALKNSQERAIDNLVVKLQPFIDLVSQQAGNKKGSELTWGRIAAAAGLGIAAFVALRSGIHPVIP